MATNHHNVPRRRSYPKPVRRSPRTVMVHILALMLVLLITLWARNDDPTSVNPRDNSEQTSQTLSK